MASAVIKPKFLQPCATIGVCAPSNIVDTDQLRRAAAALEGSGYRVILHPQCFAQDRGSAGTTAEKLAALHELFADPTIDAIFAARGGARALHMIDGLNFNLIRRNPKIFMGYSDITALHTAIHAGTGLITLHAQNINDFDPQRDGLRDTPARTLAFLRGDIPHDLWAGHDVGVLRHGTATGILCGGNMALFTAMLLAGEKYVPPLYGKILLLEDISEETSKLDRLMGALRIHGVFDQIAGLVMGYMTNITDTGVVLFDRTVNEIVLEHTAQTGIPIVFNAPHGHDHPNVPFPLGVAAQMTVATDAAPSLTLLESPFAAS